MKTVAGNVEDAADGLGFGQGIAIWSIKKNTFHGEKYIQWCVGREHHTHL